MRACVSLFDQRRFLSDETAKLRVVQKAWINIGQLGYQLSLLNSLSIAYIPMRQSTGYLSLQCLRTLHGREHHNLSGTNYRLAPWHKQRRYERRKHQEQKHCAENWSRQGTVRTMFSDWIDSIVLSAGWDTGCCDRDELVQFFDFRVHNYSCLSKSPRSISLRI